jgi:anaerobic magnesium-protoporphyrin IX monomethyl ester cyclase
MAYLKRTFNPDHIWFADDIFGFRVDWVTEFGAAVRSANAMIPYSIQTRADLVSERMARALRDSGCREAWIGAESGSQRVLDAMNKGTTVAELLSARARLKAADIRVGFFIQLGYMDEQVADITATRDLLEAARPDEIGVSVSYPLPGTKFHELVKEQLGAKTRWQESNDLEMMFHGTYTSDFYRAVRNLMHDQVALQGLDASGGVQGGMAAREFGKRELAKRELDGRWQDLLSREAHYRSPAHLTAAAG